jgi:GTP-binding protein
MVKKLEIGKIFNGKCEFLFGAHNYSQIPSNHFPEIAVIGASNVGKSSLINAILKTKTAIVSSTPGRTRQLNFFKVFGYNDGFILVDMPGYGYAKAKGKHIEHWQKTSFEYLTKRENLKRVFLLIDPIKEFKESDLDIINTFNTFGISFQIILTKIDKLNKEKVEKVYEKFLAQIKKWPAAYPEIMATSSSKNYGIKDLQQQILNSL